MKNILIAAVFVSLLAVTCMAQDLCIPGQTSGPPCAAAALSTDPEIAATVDGSATSETILDSVSPDLIIELATLSLW